MPEMSPFEQGFCRSAPWRWFARGFVVPWALQGQQPSGDVLEIGSGSARWPPRCCGASRTYG
jgi:hypothetical protein